MDKTIKQEGSRNVALFLHFTCVCYKYVIDLLKINNNGRQLLRRIAQSILR